FRAPINCNYDLITGTKFNAYREKGVGKRRLLQIKYRYYSDISLQLWHLCYAFFEQQHNINLNCEQKEYILARRFDVVFEAIIDELIGDPRTNIPRGLKDQEDGKRVDHMYRDLALTNYAQEDLQEIYYIGDSKYYKIGASLEKKSIYKQYTYARNVIQWNINLFFNENLAFDAKDIDDLKEDKKDYKSIKLRHDNDMDVTEGYDIIPNFFISASVRKDRKYDAKDENIRPHLNKKNEHSTYITYQFVNRLFDRDTLILSHYDVNFLYIIYLYARNKPNEIVWWKDKVRNLFRKEIRDVLSSKFEMFMITAKPNISAEAFIRDHFQQLNGKLFKPFEDYENRSYYSLALQRPIEHPKSTADIRRNDEFIRDQENIMTLLKGAFFIEPCAFGENPIEKFAKYDFSTPAKNMQKRLTVHFIENNLNDSFLIGIYNGPDHLRWIKSRKGNYKCDDIYNVRIGNNRPGSVNYSQPFYNTPKFIIIYDKDNYSKDSCLAFRVKSYDIIKKERMLLMDYDAKGDYLGYILDEQVTLGNLDIPSIIKDAIAGKFGNYIKYAPIYLTGEQLLKYRLNE
ncbi:MAG: restriction endonuclease, partial [Bacteroidaceae bacterium]|nr:restriction endonuclease [Bacteroidaceae bacterium]